MRTVEEIYNLYKDLYNGEKRNETKPLTEEESKLYSSYCFERGEQLVKNFKGLNMNEYSIARQLLNREDKRILNLYNEYQTDIAEAVNKNKLPLLECIINPNYYRTTHPTFNMSSIENSGALDNYKIIIYEQEDFPVKDFNFKLCEFIDSYIIEYYKTK